MDIQTPALSVRWRAGLLGFLVVLMAGCSTLPVSRSAAASSVASAQRLAILELPAGMDDDALKAVFQTESSKTDDSGLALDRQVVADAAETAFKSAFDNTGIPLYSSAHWLRVSDPALTMIGKPIATGALAILRAAAPADLYLRIRVTDYGLTPRAWKSGYVTFEIVTTLGIATLFYTHTVTRPVAGVYLVQEAVEETTEGYAGFWLVNRLSRPVRIEMDLVDGASGKVLWQDTDTGLADWRWANLWHMDAPIEQQLLNSSLNKAVDELVHALTG